MSISGRIVIRTVVEAVGYSCPLKETEFPWTEMREEADPGRGSGICKN